MSKIPSPSLQMESLTRCLGGCIFRVREDVVCSFFNILFDIFWVKYKFGLYIKTWRKMCGCLQLSFQLSKSLCSRQGFFATVLLISSHFVISRIELPKLTSSILLEIVTILVVLVNQFYFYMHHQPIKPWLFEKNYPLGQFIFAFSYGFKITCILLRQLISLKKMVVLSAKFAIFISWSPICIPLILLSALMRLASTSAAILYNSMENIHPW